jgi:hypothetical protein
MLRGIECATLACSVVLEAVCCVAKLIFLHKLRETSLPYLHIRQGYNYFNQLY